MKTVTVSLLLHDRLHAVALRHLIGTLAVSSVITDNIESSDDADLIITDTQTLASDIKRFVPRLTRVLLIGNAPVTDNHDAPMWLDCNLSESEIVDRLGEVLASTLKGNSEDVDSVLSQREIEVLRLVASGLINKEIAERLNISINTVLTHRKNITAKLGIKSVSGLSLYAMMNGLV